MNSAQRFLIGLLTALWLTFLGLNTLHVAGKPARPELQNQVHEHLLARGARLALYSSYLDQRERALWLDNLGLDETQSQLVRGQMISPEKLPAGWFRELARGTLDPARERAAADQDVLVLGLVLVWLTGILVGGSAVSLWWWMRGRRRRPQPLPNPPLDRAWLLFVSWQLGAVLLAPVLLSLGGPHPPRQLMVLVQLVLYALGLYFIRPLVGSLKLSWRGLAQGVGAAWAGSLGVLVVTQVIQRLTGSPMVSRNSALDLFRNTNSTDLIWLGFLVLLAGPFFEEYLFRGLLFGALRPNSGQLVATLVSAGIFALAHSDPIGFLPYLVLGIVFSQTYATTGSLFPAMVGHALFNAQTFVVLCLLSAG